MEMILQYYALFCLTTAISAWFIFYRPILRAALDCEIYNELTLNPMLSNLVFVIIGVLVAPLLFLAIVVPGISHSFHQSIENIVFEEESEASEE